MSDEANLARIRDNQRRSRARRKEYVQDLESRIRQWEAHGVEASSEIQLAARKVADENKRLRSLLVQYGISPEEGSLSIPSIEVGSDNPAMTLENLLGKRRSGSSSSKHHPPGRRTQDSSPQPSSETDSLLPRHDAQPFVREASVNSIHSFETTLLPAGQLSAPSRPQINEKNLSPSSSRHLDYRHSSPHMELDFSQNPGSSYSSSNAFQMSGFHGNRTASLSPQPTGQNFEAPQAFHRRATLGSPANFPVDDDLTLSMNLDNYELSSNPVSSITGCTHMNAAGQFGYTAGMECPICNPNYFNVLDTFRDNSRSNQ